MIELKISNREYLTHEDLDRYLDEYHDFLKESFLNKKMLDFEWDEFLKNHISKIEEEINKNDKIELIVENVRKINLPGVQFQNEVKKIRGQEGLINWKNIPTLQDIYEISFKQLKVYITKEPTFKDEEHRVIQVFIPEVIFKKITSKKPNNLKLGDRFMFRINILDRERFWRFSTYSTIIYLNYYETEGVFPIKQKKTTRKLNTEVTNTTSNSNCFVVTATMGDVNHPIVNDFRKFRDDVLLNTITGKTFIKIYYQFGPLLANTIRSNTYLLKISRKVILWLHTKIK
jgi:cell fate (sporulation/competence/biofilm development) regulator YmcA (YheA/YmcA/DUF963 family)